MSSHITPSSRELLLAHSRFPEAEADFRRTVEMKTANICLHPPEGSVS